MTVDMASSSPGLLGENRLESLKRMMDGKKLQLDQKTIDHLKKQALQKAQRLREQAARQTQQSVQQAQTAARDIAASRTPQEGSRKIWWYFKQLEGSAAVAGFARFLVALYFVNLAYENIETYFHMNSPEMALRAKQFPGSYKLPRYPWFDIWVLVPCATLVVLGIKTSLFASILVLDMLWDSARLLWHGLMMLVMYSQRPNELMVKRVAMLGCSALVLAHAVKQDRQLGNTYAGLLNSKLSSRQDIGIRRSLVLLVGRLLVCCLFVFVGYGQIKRVIARDWAFFRQHSAYRGLTDGHDNNWLLAEFALALPFAVGFKTAAVSRLLALCLSLEALTCWRFWNIFPTWHYHAHVRSHFMTNMGVAGGLILLQSFGAGRFAVDSLMRKKE